MASDDFKPTKTDSELFGKWQTYQHDKIDLFPPTFNELREVMHRDFPTLWSIAGGMMLHDHEMLLETLNAALDCNVNPLHHSLSEGCEIWLTKLLLLRRSGQSGIILADRAIDYHKEKGMLP